jgi:hypothetical protein
LSCRKKWFSYDDRADLEKFAEFLIANGVAVQRHGKWICISEPDENDNVQCKCSVCEAGDLHAKNTVVPYCPHCGAKMDGD